MNVGRNGSQSYYHVGTSCVTDNILKDDCRNILSDFKTIDSGDLEFYFSKIDVQFSMELFFCCSPVDCLHSHFIVLLCAFGNGVGMAVTQWESHGNGTKTPI